MSFVGGGRFRGYDSKVPIAMINGIVKDIHNYTSVGVGYSDNMADIKYLFEKKYKKIKNPNFNLMSYLNIFSKNRTPIKIVVEIKPDTDKMKEAINSLLKNHFPDFCLKQSGYSFNIDIISEDERKMRDMKKKMKAF